MTKIVEVTQGPWTGLVGSVHKETHDLYWVRKPDGHGSALVNRQHAVEAEVYSNSESKLHIPDIDSGLGIWGINNDQSLPTLPSRETIERVQHLYATDVICRRCGASKNFDGAMFTTGGGDICDDCF